MFNNDYQDLLTYSHLIDARPGKVDIAYLSKDIPVIDLGAQSHDRAMTAKTDSHKKGNNNHSKP